MTVSSSFLLLCDNFIVDTSNRFSLINIFDFLNADKLPTTYTITVVGNMQLSQGLHKINLYLVDPDSDKSEILTRSEILGQDEKKNIVIQGVFEFKKKGEYIFELWDNDQLMATRNLQVILNKNNLE